jgi:hypothetical protein
LHSTKWSNGKTKKDGNHFLPKNNLIQNSEGKEQNAYPALDSNKTRIMMPRNPTMPTRKPQRRNPASNH